MISAADFATSSLGEPPERAALQVELKQVIFWLFFCLFMRPLPLWVHTAPVGAATGAGESSVWRCRPRRSCNFAVQKNVTLKSDDQEIEVRPLPVAGRPNGFTGAVGDFKIDVWDMPAEWQTGEPKQIAARLSWHRQFRLDECPRAHSGGRVEDLSGQR